jgi:outer membrane lipoprotein-sorting protein
MKRLAILFSMIIALQVTATNQIQGKDYTTLNSEFIYFENDTFDVEQELFEELFTVTINVKDIKVIEEEEDIKIDFNTKDYLPKRFNAYKGMFDLNWDTIELVEIEEDLDFGYETQDNLPINNLESNAKAIIASRE